MQIHHVPVLLKEVLDVLRPHPGGYYIDGTLGSGGHTAALLERSAPSGKVLGIDADEQALARVRPHLAEFVENGRLILAHGNFADMTRIAQDTGFVSASSEASGSGSQGVQGILLDLGFSSDQMENAQRGFSFSTDGPLDMRLDQSLPFTAADLVNSASEHELADIIWRYGEETRSRQIARRIVREREKQALTRTAQLARLAAAGVPHKPGAIHPATKTFQALRIAVNKELERLGTVLPSIPAILHKQPENESQEVSGDEDNNGRVAIISFHSLEDRIVKEFMRREAGDCICPPRTPVCICGHKASLRILTPKPIAASAQEIATNPRARSAKLRAAVRK